MSVGNYKELKAHLGHKIVCVGYALRDKEGNRRSAYSNVAIECADCCEVLLDFENTDFNA